MLRAAAGGHRVSHRGVRPSATVRGVGLPAISVQTWTLSLDSLVFDACLNGHYSRSGRTELPGNVGGDEEDADHIPYKFFRRLTPHGPLHGMYEGDMRFGKHSSLPGQCRTYSPCVLFS